MTDSGAEFESEVYRVDKELADGRGVEPLSGSYVGDDGRVRVGCPSCDYDILAEELVLEGGGQCDGCGRNVRLHATSHDLFGEWRNVPKDRQEAYR